MPPSLKPERAPSVSLEMGCCRAVGMLMGSEMGSRRPVFVNFPCPQQSPFNLGLGARVSVGNQERQTFRINRA